MQKTAAALITYLVAACALLAIAFGPQAVSDVHEAVTIADSRATVAPASFTAQCTTDAECAEWDAQGYTAVEHDAAGEPFCAPGTDLYDTEKPDMGDRGVVCVES